MNEKYLKDKMRDIEEEVAVAVGVANMTGCMFGKCTNQVIETRNIATKNIQKIVRQILKKSNVKLS